MPDTVTPNYNLVKPEVTGSIDTWGNKLNTDLDILDTQMKLNETKAGNSLQKTGTAADRTAGDYIYYATGITAANAGPQALLTNNDVRYLCNILLPVGSIIMWVGAVSNIPYGWALCNGQTVNGYATPNLTDRMVVAAGGTWAPHGVGGTASLNYSDYTAYYALTINEMPQHYHPVSDPTHNHSFTTSATDSDGLMGRSDNIGAYWVGSTGGAKAWAFVGGQVLANGTGVSTQYQGASWGHRHPMSFSIPWSAYWPQFYALAFLMRVIPF